MASREPCHGGRLLKDLLVCLQALKILPRAEIRADNSDLLYSTPSFGTEQGRSTNLHQSYGKLYSGTIMLET